MFTSCTYRLGDVALQKEQKTTSGCSISLALRYLLIANQIGIGKRFFVEAQVHTLHHILLTKARITGGKITDIAFACIVRWRSAKSSTHLEDAESLNGACFSHWMKNGRLFCSGPLLSLTKHPIL